MQFVLVFFAHLVAACRWLISVFNCTRSEAVRVMRLQVGKMLWRFGAGYLFLVCLCVICIITTIFGVRHSTVALYVRGFVWYGVALRIC